MSRPSSPTRRNSCAARSARRALKIPNSANSQFFITFQPTPPLNGQYTIWGQVIDGMDAVDKIKRGEPPSNPDKIVKVQVASDADQASQDAATAVLQKQN